MGETIGICQWDVLRSYKVPHAAWWIVVTNLGWTVAIMLTSFLDLSGEIFNNFYGDRGAILGGLLGLTQYLFLRRYSRHWQKSVIWLVGTAFTGFLLEAILQISSQVVRNPRYSPTIFDYFFALLFLTWPFIAITVVGALPGWMLALIFKDYLD